MLRLFPPALLAILVLCLALPLPAASQATGFAIAVDKPEFATSVVTGRLVNVPPGATSALVTITLSDGSTRSQQTTAAQEWRFTFSDTYLTGPWLQLTALASSGAGASLPNPARVSQAENFVAENTPTIPNFNYPYYRYPGGYDYGYLGYGYPLGSYGYPYWYGSYPCW